MNSTTMVALRRVAIALAFVAVLVRPGYGERELVTEVADVEVMVVVDRTRSMAALDFGDARPRIRGVQRDLRALVESLPGTRFSLLTWATDARLELPFTTDHAAFLNAVNTLQVEDPFDSTGTRVDTPLRPLVEALKQAEEQYPDRERMLVFVSDGENTAGGRPDSYERIAPYVDGGLVLGYGKQGGAPMPLGDLSGADGLVQFEGREAISRPDRRAMQAVADQTGTDFVARTGPGGIQPLAARFEGEFTEHADETLPVQNDLTWVAGLVLLGLLLWELHAHWRAVWGTPTTLGARRRRTEEVVT